MEKPILRADHSQVRLNLSVVFKTPPLSRFIFPDPLKLQFFRGRDLLPKEYGKNKDNDKTILEKYKELSGLSELEAKSKYVHLCRGLKTYGVTFFVVKGTNLNR